MAASARISVINPLDYIFQAMEIKMETIQEIESEFMAIKTYLTNTQENSSYKLRNLYRVQRRGEAERINKWADIPNHFLLWHGSRSSNFIGILSEGLRVAPASALHSGAAYGKGIYFADMFAKSIGYCGPIYGQSSFMLLCEVALGKMRSAAKTNSVEELPQGYHSLCAKGSKRPSFSESIVLPNGVRIPIGSVETSQDQRSYTYYSEYIVPDVSQVRIRYIVEIDQ